MKGDFYEELNFDHVDEPEIMDAIRPFGYWDDMLCVNSFGFLKEGQLFNNYHYGFGNYSLRATLDGRGALSCCGRNLELGRGDVTFINNYEPSNVYANDEAWQFYFFNISGKPCRMFERMWNRNGPTVIHLGDMSVIEETYNALKSVGTVGLLHDLDMHRILTDLLTTLLMEHERSSAGADETTAPSWVYEAIEYISVNYRDNAMISAMADRFFNNRAYFARQFKKYTGKSPKEYQMCCRMEAAVELLRGTTLSAATIAEQTGFASPSLFAKSFREVYGQSPSEYRKNSTKNDR